MSILIKGMKMPKTCEACPFAGWSNLYQTSTCKFLSVYDGKYSAFDSFSREYLTKRSEYCPLVEVPTPHGDLIDRDALIKQWEKEEKELGLVFGVALIGAMNEMKEFPIVIESEE